MTYTGHSVKKKEQFSDNVQWNNIWTGRKVEKGRDTAKGLNAVTTQCHGSMAMVSLEEKA